MSERHEKANRKDKAFKPHYWETWHEEAAGLLPSSRPLKPGYLPPSGTHKIYKSAPKKQSGFTRDTKRKLRYVSKMGLRELLDPKLIQVCRSQAGRYKKTFEVKLKRNRWVCERTIVSERDESALWVSDAVDFLIAWAKRLQAQKSSSASLADENSTFPKEDPQRPTALRGWRVHPDEIIEEIHYAEKHLSHMFSISDAFASGELPVGDDAIDAAKDDPVTQASLCMIHGLLHLRSSLDLFFHLMGKKFMPKSGA